MSFSIPRPLNILIICGGISPTLLINSLSVKIFSGELISIILPSDIVIIFGCNLHKNSMSCEMTIIVLLLLCSVFMNSNKIFFCNSSCPTVGSSRINISGFHANTDAKHTFFFSPPLSFNGDISSYFLKSNKFVINSYLLSM